ncbi:MAG: NAD-dependent epimerase/dehydratase family protein [Verrucomicrobiales bacterium]
MATLVAPQDLTDLHRLVSAPSPEVVASLGGVSGDILVLGAGGKMGYHLALMLVRAIREGGGGNRVYAVSRFGGGGSRDPFEDAGIATLSCDLASEHEVAKLPLAPTVFFLAGVKFGTSEDPEVLRRMNVEMPRLVGKQFRESSIVALSTGCVYPFVSPWSGGATEEIEPAPTGGYASSCLGREAAFAEVSGKYGTPVSLIRLNYAVDLRYGVLVDIALSVAAGDPIDVSTGYVNVIWQGDALAQIIRSLHEASSPPFVLNVTGQKTLRVREVAENFGRIFGKEVRLEGEEKETAWLSCNARSRKLYGAPSVSEEALIEAVAQWVSSGGEVMGKPTHFEVRDGKF